MFAYTEMAVQNGFNICTMLCYVTLEVFPSILLQSDIAIDCY